MTRSDNHSISHPLMARGSEDIATDSHPVAADMLANPERYPEIGDRVPMVATRGRVVFWGDSPLRRGVRLGGFYLSRSWCDRQSLDTRANYTGLGDSGRDNGPRRRVPSVRTKLMTIPKAEIHGQRRRFNWRYFAAPLAISLTVALGWGVVSKVSACRAEQKAKEAIQRLAAEGHAKKWLAYSNPLDVTCRPGNHCDTSGVVCTAYYRKRKPFRLFCSIKGCKPYD